ncbi:MAG: hypothetical protein WC934_06885 [Acidithiobacillus sp.]|jgi:hypothetical protein|uniref:hypothetical protein n=1 Tax=Acidithiobacillus sp. TaxID=1872118 RepID=UPI00355CB7BC
MVQQKKECLEFKPIKKQLIVVLLIFSIFIPTTIILYINIKPRIEKVYNYSFDTDFQINPFIISYYNKSINDYNNISFSHIDIGTKINVTSIEFGFNNYNQNYDKQEYQKSIIYFQSENSSLNYNIKYGDYLVRSFKFQNFTSFVKQMDMNKFKMGQEYTLFFITIIFETYFNNIPYLIKYYNFYETSETNLNNNNELQINIKSLYFNSSIFDIDYQSLLLYPYQIITEITKLAYSLDLFNFNFR